LPPRPNILLVLADQLSARALAAYGGAVARTPNLDRLAERGVVFERALCASPLCVPSRAALATGLLPSSTCVYDNASELGAAVPTFAHHLRVLGYRTVVAGKMHFVGPDQLHGFEERPMPDVYPAGFDWVPDWRLEDHETLPWYHDLSSVRRAGPVRATLQIEYDLEVVHHARDAIAASARAADRPLLLVASFTHPHDPYEVTREHWDRYADVEIDLPAHTLPPDPADAPTRRLRAMLGFDRESVSADEVARARRGYYAAMSLVDDHVGAILATLAEHGLADDTVVVFTSDHGDMLGERGLWYKMAPFEDSIRVPLVVHAPARFEPRRVAEVVSLLDLLPTLVELAGGEPPECDGSSLAPALDGDGPPQRDLPVEYLAEGVRAPQVTVVRGPLKVIRELGEPDLAYDLEHDPYERSPVAAPPDLHGRWDLPQLDADVRASQERRRLVARALATGRQHPWDHPGEPGGPYIRTGQDFWATLEAYRRP
jgi:choline-sulfatase